MATGAEMIGYVLSALITTTVEKASSYVPLPIGLCGHDDSDLLKLRANLALALAVVAKAIRLPITDECFAKLLVRLKGVIYDANDFLGELEYRQLEQRSGSIFLRCFLKYHEEDVVDKLRKIQENMEIITCNLKGIVEIHGSQHWGKQVDNSRVRFKPETSSLLPKHVFGRDQEKEMIVQMLLNLHNRSSGDVRVVSILGPAGVGKTTMAQIICNGSRIKEHFDMCMWIHTACEPFNVSEILKQIIELLPGKRHLSELTNLGYLQRLVMEELRSKRFLLVLDDMWNEDKSKLDNLIAPLRGLHGSTILVTAQSKKVADAMEATDSIILEGLPDESILSVFETDAFESRKSENYPNLKALGEKMIGKFMGSPLPAKIVGSKLNSNLNETYWRYVKDTEFCTLPQGEDNVLQVIRPSYSRLPPHLQQCVSYCSLYPKDHEFEKESLVQMWIAHDYVKPEGTMRIEDIGSSYFKDLTDRYFFLKQPNGYVMHPLLHQLARYVSKDEFFAIEGGNSHLVIPDTVRHISVKDSNMEVSQFINMCKDKNLRSILFLGNIRPELGYALGKLKGVNSSIRVLVLGCCRMEKLPDSMCKWTQLQYFDASGTEIRRLPKPFWRLYKLQVLKMPKCCVLHIPKVSKLINKLRYLDAGKDNISRIKKIGRLTSLQKLGEYKVLKERMRMIGELKDMNELRGSLHISDLENVGGLEEASQAQLKNKRHIDELILEWGSKRQCSKGIDDEHDAKVLEGLQPHPNLQVLEINSYVGITSPVWLKDNLLPNLEKVSFRNCPNLQSLTQFTLKSLTIENCPELKSLPEDGLPKSLLSFHLRNCPDLKDRCRKDSGADWHKIAHITSLYFDGECIA